MRAFKELSSFLEKQITAVQAQWNKALGEQASDLEELQTRYLSLLDLKTELDSFKDRLMGLDDAASTPVVKKAAPVKKAPRKAATKKKPAPKAKKTTIKRANAYPKGTVFQANYKKTPINVIVTADKTLDYQGKPFKSMRELSMYLNDGVPSYLASLKNWTILAPGKAPAVSESKAAPAPKKKGPAKATAKKAKAAPKKAVKKAAKAKTAPKKAKKAAPKKKAVKAKAAPKKVAPKDKVETSKTASVQTEQPKKTAPMENIAPKTETAAATPEPKK